MPEFLDGAGWPRLLRDIGYYCTNNAKEDYNTAALDITRTWDESSPAAHWRNRPNGAPFFAIFNLDVTHESQVHGSPEIGSISPVQVQIPAYSPDTGITRADMATYMLRIEQMDAQLNARLTELDQDGVAHNTIVLYYSDHAGVLPRSKRFCYDSGLHVPLIARFGNSVAHLAPAAAGSFLTEPINTGTSLPPTILGMAGQTVPAQMTGTAFAGPQRDTEQYAFAMRQRMDERYDMVRTVRDERYRYIRNYMPHLPNGQHIDYQTQQRGYREWEELFADGALSDTQARFWRDRPAEELYDIHNDPHEITNLAGDPEYSDTHHRMSAALDDHMIGINDNGFIPESQGRQIITENQHQDPYPLKDVMQLASTAIRRDPSNVNLLLSALSSDNNILRYWAAQGFCMLDRLAPHAESRIRNTFANEPCPQVKVVLAEALCRHYDARVAVEYLGQKLATHPDPYVRLQAANALDNIGERARPVLPQLLESAAQVEDWPKIDVTNLTADDIEELTKRLGRHADAQARQRAPLVAKHAARKLQRKSQKQ